MDIKIMDLRKQCLAIAKDLEDLYNGTYTSTTDEEYEDLYDYLSQNTYDIRFICDGDKNYLGAELMIAGGGPTIYVNCELGTIDGYSGSEKVSIPVDIDLANELYNYGEMLYN